MICMLVTHILRTSPSCHLRALHKLIAHPIILFCDKARRIRDSMPEHHLPWHLLTEPNNDIRHRAPPSVIEYLVILQRNIPSSERQIIRTGRESALLESRHIIARSLRTHEFLFQDFRIFCPVRIDSQLIDCTIKRTVNRQTLVLHERRHSDRRTADPKIILLLVNSRKVCIQPRHLFAIDCKVKSVAAAEHGGNP